jgi:hypothetical protein
MKFNPFAHPAAADLRQQALSKALVELHEAKIMSESWNSMLALQIARVARLQGEIADAKLEFPPLDLAQPKSISNQTKMLKLFGGKTL